MTKQSPIKWNLSSMAKKENEIVDGERADDDGDRPATDRGAR